RRPRTRDWKLVMERNSKRTRGTPSPSRGGRGRNRWLSVSQASQARRSSLIRRNEGGGGKAGTGRVTEATPSPRTPPPLLAGGGGECVSCSDRARSRRRR